MYIQDMMKRIIEYEDYRKYLRDFYEEHKRIGAFTWRDFSKLAGSNSASFLKMVCDGKNGLSKLGVERVANAMALNGDELIYFRALVTFCQTKKENERKKAYEEMQAIASEYKVRVLEGESFKFYESWQYPVIRELAPMMPGAKPLEIAKRCAQPITAAEVRASLDFLVKSHFLTKTAEDTYELADKVLKVSSAAIPLAVRSMQSQMAEFAKNAIENVPSEKRDFSGVTMGIDKDDFNEIVAELKELRKKVISIATRKKGGENVYRLNLQLFPLTNEKEA